jgi:hypothetical protein
VGTEGRIFDKRQTGGGGTSFRASQDISFLKRIWLESLAPRVEGLGHEKGETEAGLVFILDSQFDLKLK